MTTRYAVPPVIYRMPTALRHGAQHADDNGKTEAAQQLRGAANQLDGALIEAQAYEVADRLYVLVPARNLQDISCVGPFLSLAEACEARDELARFEDCAYHVLPLEPTGPDSVPEG